MLYVKYNICDNRFKENISKNKKSDSGVLLSFFLFLESVKKLNNIQVNSNLKPQTPPIIDDIQKYLNCFNANSGYYCFCLKPSRDRKKQWEQMFTNNLEEVYKWAYTYKSTHNCYLAQATFKNTRSRNASNIEDIRRLYVDIDSDNNNSLSKYQCEELATLINERTNLPEPTITVYSGHGIQMIWNVDETIGQKWTMYETAVHGMIKEALEDIKQNSISQLAEALELYNVHLDLIKDKARVLRISGTRNIKIEKEPVYAEIIGYTGKEYTSADIHIPEPEKPRKKAKKPKIKQIKEKEINSQYMNEIIRPRLYDLEKLIELRNSKGVVSGYRNTLISMVVGTCCSLGYSKEQALEICRSFNIKFNQPLPEGELIDWIKTTYKLRRVENEYKRGCKWKTTTIIKKLGITTAEQKEMNVLKDTKEATREEKRNQKAERNKKIKELRAKGWSCSMIANELGIHRNTVSNVIKKIEQSCTKNALIKGESERGQEDSPRKDIEMQEKLDRFTAVKHEICKLLAEYESLLIRDEETKQTGTEPEVPEEIIEELELKPQGIYLVKHLIASGAIETANLYQKQWKQNIINYQTVIIERNSSREVVNKCIDRVVCMKKQGNVRNFGAYLQTSLERLKKDD